MLRKYGGLGSLMLFASYLFTKLFYPRSRLLRLPIDIRNKKLIDLGKGLTTGYGCRLEAYPVNKTGSKCLIFGDNIEINDYVHIAAGEKVSIGDHVLIAGKVFISDINHGNYKGQNPDSPLSVPNSRGLSTRPVIIEDNVWIGESVSILPGVTIGRGSIIGANSVVSKNIPPAVIAVGSPAKPVKKYNFQSNIWENL
jgi:acetyltransferase-like isoleucine patch superfamily enzyme